MKKPMNFRERFCARVPCAETAYESALFWRGLYRHAVPLAILIRWVAPGFFRDDVEFIRYLAGDASMDEVAEDIDRFEYGNRVRRHWLRTGLRIRVDAWRVAGLARRCFAA